MSNGSLPIEKANPDVIAGTRRAKRCAGVEDRTKRLLLTHERFAPDFAGFGEYVALQIARHLLRRGVDIRVLTMGDPHQTDYEGIPTRRLPDHRYTMSLYSAQIAREAVDADLIQTFHYHACDPSFRAARRLGKPAICEYLAMLGDAWREMKSPWAGRAFSANERFLLRLPFDQSV